MAVIDPVAAVPTLRNIHREFRTAALNMKYYGYKLVRYQRANTIVEVLIACGATTGTGIAGFAIWKNGAGTTAWEIISGLSIILATLKPIIALPKQIERYSKLASSYATIFETYRGMEQDFKGTGLTTEQVAQYNQLRAEVVKLAADDDRNPSRKRIKRFADEVNKEIPAWSLWMPAPAPPAAALPRPAAAAAEPPPPAPPPGGAPGP
jgi:hypothetical protein